MKCDDLQELLSAYSDGELDHDQRKLVETHLKNCVTCRLVLDEFNNTREYLQFLRVTPNTLDIKGKIMEEIGTMKPNIGLKRFLRPALIAVPVVVIVAVVLALQPLGISEDSSGVIAKAYAATGKLDSFHSVRDEYFQDSPSEEPVHSIHAETKYVAPDRYYMSNKRYNDKIPGLEEPMETISIGNQVYTNIPTFAKIENDYFEQLILTEEKTLDYLNLLAEVESLDDEIIDGTECYHYIGDVDIDKYLEYQRPILERGYYRMDKDLPWGMTTSLEEYIEDSNTRSRTQDMIFEFWIGKDDYLLRKVKMIYETREGEISDWNKYRYFSIVRYYDLNENITIETPLDESGELLAGWISYTAESLEIPDESDIPKVTPVAKIPDENEEIPAELLKAAAVTEKLGSYRVETVTWEHFNDTWDISSNDLREYGGFNLYRLNIQPTEEYMKIHPMIALNKEMILVGDRLYSKGFPTPRTRIGDMNAGDPIREDERELMKMLFAVETLEEEDINGTICYHFRGIIDIEKYLEWFHPFVIENVDWTNEGIDPELGWSYIEKFCRNIETIYEYWIGKDDYVLRKSVKVERKLAANTLPVDDLSHESTKQTITYYLDFNEPVEIKAPLDDSGELLEGWFVVTQGE